MRKVTAAFTVLYFLTGTRQPAFQWSAIVKSRALRHLYLFGRIYRPEP